MHSNYFKIDTASICMDYYRDSDSQMRKGAIALAARAIYESLLSALTAKLDDSSTNYHGYERNKEWQRWSKARHTRPRSLTPLAVSKDITPHMLPSDFAASFSKLLKRCKRESYGYGPPISFTNKELSLLFKLFLFRNAIAHPKPYLDFTFKIAEILEAMLVAVRLTSFILRNCCPPSLICDDDEVTLIENHVTLMVKNQLRDNGCFRTGEMLYEYE